MTKKSFIAFTIIFLCHAVFMVIWAVRDKRLPSWDQAVHIGTSHQLKKNILSLDFKSILITENWSGHPPYPPFVHALMAIGSSLGNKVGLSIEDGALLANLFFLGMLMCGSFLIICHYFDENKAIVAAFLASAAPSSLFFMCELLVDYGLMAVVVMAYACWIKSEQGSKMLWMIFGTLIHSMGMLVKWSFFIYVLPIYVQFVPLLFFQRFANRRRTAWICLFIGVAIISPWYVANIASFGKKVSRAASLGKIEGDPDILSWDGWIWYLKSFALHFTTFGLILGTMALGWLFLRKRQLAGTLTLWLIVSYVAWSMVSNKNDRYMLPASLVFPLAISVLPLRIPYLVAALMVVNMGLWSAWPQYAHFSQNIISQKWPLEEIVARAASKRSQHLTPSRLVVFPNTAEMNSNSFRWIIEREGLQDQLTARGRIHPLGQFSEFMIVKTGIMDVFPNRTDRLAARSVVLDSSSWFRRYYEKLDEWKLPDGSLAHLFQLTSRRSYIPHAGDKLPTDFLPGWSFYNSTIKVAEPQNSRFPSTWTISASSITIKDIALHNVKLKLEGVIVGLNDNNEMVLLRCSAIRFENAQLIEHDLQHFIDKKSKGRFAAHLSFDQNNNIIFRISKFGLEGTAEIHIADSMEPSPEQSVSKELILNSLSIGPVSFQPHFRYALSHKYSSNLPYNLSLASVRTSMCEGSWSCLEVK